MTADLSAEEYYEIYLRSKDAKQGKEKNPSTQLARGGSFKVVSQTGQKAQRAIPRSKSFKVIRFRDQMKEPEDEDDDESDPLSSQRILEENKNDFISERLASLKKVADCNAKNDEDTVKERHPSNSIDPSRQGNSGNVTNLMSITERVRQLTSAMASGHSSHSGKGFNKFTRRIQTLGDDEKGVLESPSGRKDSSQVAPIKQGSVSGLQSLLNDTQIIKGLTPSGSSSCLFEKMDQAKDEVDASTGQQNWNAGPLVSDFDLIVPDSESLVHYRKFGPKPHKRSKVSRNPVKVLLLRKDLKDLSSECPQIRERILQRLSMTDDEDDEDGEDASVQSLLMTFCGMSSDEQLKKSAAKDDEDKMYELESN